MNKYQKALDNHNEMLDMIEGINEMQGKKVKFDRSGLLLLQKLVDKAKPLELHEIKVNTEILDIKLKQLVKVSKVINKDIVVDTISGFKRCIYFEEGRFYRCWWKESESEQKENKCNCTNCSCGLGGKKDEEN